MKTNESKLAPEEEGKLTNEQKVKQVYPDACVWAGFRHYKIMPIANDDPCGKNPCSLGSGQTPKEAWAGAAINLPKSANPSESEPKLEPLEGVSK